MLFACAGIASAQAFTYSYIDPCTGKKQYVIVNEPNGSITMSYNKFIKTFRIEDFNSGAFDIWLEQIKNNIPGNNPCGGVGVETTTNTKTQIAVNTVAVVTNVVTTVTSNIVSAGPSPADIANSGGGGGGSDVAGGGKSDCSSGDSKKTSKTGKTKDEKDEGEGDSEG